MYIDTDEIYEMERELKDYWRGAHQVPAIPDPCSQRTPLSNPRTSIFRRASTTTLARPRHFATFAEIAKTVTDDL